MQERASYVVAVGVVFVLCVVLLSCCVVLRPIGWILEYEYDKEQEELKRNTLGNYASRT